MKKSFKTFLSIFMGAIFSFFILPSAFAHLNPAQKAELDQVCNQYIDAFASNRLRAWRKNLMRHIIKIAGHNTHDRVIAARAFAYVTCKILDRETLEDFEIQCFSIFESRSGVNRLPCLNCQIITVDNSIIFLRI